MLWLGKTAWKPLELVSWAFILLGLDEIDFVRHYTFDSGITMTFSKHKLWCALLTAALVWMLPNSEVSANGGAWGGSFGSGGGSFGSGGGSWGSSGGGLLGGRRPVRNLLSRISDRMDNIGGGSWGSGGSSGGSFGGSGGGSFGGSSGGGGGFLRGGLLSRVFGGRRSGGSYGGSNGNTYGGSSGGSYGSYVSTNSFASASDFSYPTTTMAPLAETSYGVPSATFSNIAPFSAPAPASNFTMEQSYPIGDQRLVPGLPVYNSYLGGNALMGGNVIGGQTVEGAFNGGFTPVPTGTPSAGIPTAAGDASAIQDGGSIDAMLEGNALPTEGNVTPYYDGVDPNVPNPGPKMDDGTFFQRMKQLDQVAADEAILRLNVPKEAKVYVNGRLTKTPGAVRSYESKNLSSDRAYHFKIKAVVERNGKQLVRSKLISLRAGHVKNALLDFDSPATTVLALNVPKNAKVKLCGAETKLTGANRRFTTTRLTDGDVCEDYKVEVSYEVDGRMVNRVRTIDLAAGDLATLTFGKDIENHSDSTSRLAAR
jgi:uncharacterized protein (TIGR03000 family)